MNTPKTRRENEVWQACDDLWALNATLESLKGDSIKEQLIKLGYKKGSPNEIYKYRQSWKQSRGIDQKALIDNTPAPDPISRAVSLVYEQMQQETLQKIAAMQCDTDAQVQELSSHKKALEEELEILAVKYRLLEEQHHGLQVAHETLNQALANEKSQSNDLGLRLEGCQTLLSELKNTYTEQIQKLETKLQEQGFELSERLNGTRVELAVCRADNLRFLKKIERLQSAGQKRQDHWIHKEFSKLAGLVKKLKSSKPQLKKKPRLPPKASLP